MVYIAIPYFSGSGHTRKLAEFIAEGTHQIEGVQSTPIDVEKISDADWKCLHQSHGIIFGSPTYMGSVAGAFKAFMDQSGTHWKKQLWTDKIAAGFTIATSPSGDKLNTLTTLAIYAAQLGMIWVGQSHPGSVHTGDQKDINHDGSWLGLMASSDENKNHLIRERDVETARFFGRRVAEATRRWNHQTRKE